MNDKHKLCVKWLDWYFIPADPTDPGCVPAIHVFADMSRVTTKDNLDNFKKEVEAMICRAYSRCYVPSYEFDTVYFNPRTNTAHIYVNFSALLYSEDTEEGIHEYIEGIERDFACNFLKFDSVQGFYDKYSD